ncbi:hypothetical protein M422DRAFT_265473 [Sphaerobolus stellatus SS14]|uniref:Uncharacterized protein n=1 Tax=Sphaerobolus stellatus (strain SS14) TaxID=990650 RepID=A0A0C9V5E0_SPHS4|nr:hypothetical protein M422DRAFT_265473 [Sphaerobolus stellatus SS14]
MPTSLLIILFEVIRDIVKELFYSVRNKQDMTKEVDASTSHLTRVDFKSPKELMVLCLVCRKLAFATEAIFWRSITIAWRLDNSAKALSKPFELREHLRKYPNIATSMYFLQLEFWVHPTEDEAAFSLQLFRWRKDWNFSAYKTRKGELCPWRAILRNILVQNTKLPRLLAGRDCTWVSGLKDHTVPSLQHLQATLGDDILDLLKATRPALKSIVLAEEPENDIIWERFQDR